jgi:hypothetical protein
LEGGKGDGAQKGNNTPKINEKQPPVGDPEKLEGVTSQPQEATEVSIMYIILFPKYGTGLGLVWVWFMVFNATFNNISAIYSGGQFYWWRKLEYLEKTTI